MKPKLLALIEKAYIEERSSREKLTIYLNSSNSKLINARQLLSLADHTDLSIFQIAQSVSGFSEKLLKINFFKLLLVKFIMHAGINDQKVSDQVVNRALDCFATSLNGSSFDNMRASVLEEIFLKPFSREFNMLTGVVSAENFKYYPVFNQQTYRNRYPHHENILRKNIINPLMARNQKSKTISIISLGCSYGYGLLDTFNILAENQGIMKDWQIILIGHDISTETLATARKETFKDLPNNVQVELIPTILGHPAYMESICSRNYDLALVRKIAMYLQRPVVDHYRNNLQAQYVFTTDDFIPGKQYDIYREAEHDYEHPIFIRIKDNQQ